VNTPGERRTPKKQDVDREEKDTDDLCKMVRCFVECGGDISKCKNDDSLITEALSIWANKVKGE